MKFSFASHLENREKGDFLILPFWEGPSEAASFSSLQASIETTLAAGDFKGKNGETFLVYAKDKEPRICLLGLGKKEKITGELLRRAYAEAAKIAQAKKAKKVNLLAPHAALAPIAEGMLLSNYSFTQLKGSKERLPVLMHEICWIGEKINPAEFERIKTIAEGVYFVRDLVNGNADDVTPKMLADLALSFSSPLRTKVLNRKQLEEEKMGLILAVSRASPLEPFLIEVSYQGDPSSKEHIVLIGKGVTYDTGGLAIKTVDNMATMKCDMSGAATVLGAVKTAAALHLKVNVTALVPAVENAIGSKSYKLGDVYRSASGKTVEVMNTDAEGRLILADALTYAQKHLRPTCMVDLASLTGAIVVGLGDEISGLFASDEALSSDLMESSQHTGELLWPMPLHEDYADSLKSDIADLVNIGGRDGGAVKAALFLKEFVQSVPWAHIDFAGPCYWTKPKRYHPTKATGYGVRMLIDFLTRRAAS